MALKAGSIFKKVKLKDRTLAVLRAPKWEDVDELLAFVNGLIDEGDLYLSIQTKPTWEEELDWHANNLAQIERGKVVACVAEVSGRIVGNSSVTKRSGIQAHVGDLGISVQKDYRNLGLGTNMMKVLIDESHKMGLKIVRLNVFSGNNRAIYVYEKVGFKEVGCIPKAYFKWGRDFDEIIMAIEL
jgi:RimJ/RimL family protein N-acetyltransferase